MEAVVAQSLREKHAADLAAVLRALQRVAPILSSYIDEHCALFLPGIGTEESAWELFAAYNAAVDSLVVSLLSDHAVELSVAARALVLARESAGDDVVLVTHLLALESFELFQDLMVRRNEAMHKEARAQLTSRGGAASGSASGSATGSADGGAGSVLSPSEKLRQMNARYKQRPDALPKTRFAMALRDASRREREERDEVDAALGSHGEGSKEGPGRSGALTNRRRQAEASSGSASGAGGGAAEEANLSPADDAWLSSEVFVL